MERNRQEEKAAWEYPNREWDVDGSLLPSLLVPDSVHSSAVLLCVR